MISPAPGPGAPVGFCGSRSLSGSGAASCVSSVVRSVVASGRPVAVGCARGADELVRLSCPSALVFSVASGRWGAGPGAFAARSVALVSSVSALVGFVSSECPAGLQPSRVPGRCFCGKGSGSWASLALAAGRGLPVVVFLFAGAALPAWPRGSWVPASPSGAWAPGWRWSPAQIPLLSLPS